MNCKYCKKPMKNSQLGVYTDLQDRSSIMVYFESESDMTLKNGWAHMQCAIDSGEESIRIVKDRLVFKIQMDRKPLPPIEIDLDFDKNLDWGGAKQW